MSHSDDTKLIVYQVFPRILSNETTDCVPFGSYERNGCGKMNHYTARMLRGIRELGVNCIWYTGIIEHATKTSFDQAGIQIGRASCRERVCLYV